MNPNFPVYIVSKTRWQKHRRLTARYLEWMKVPFYIVVEESQYKQYSRAVRKGTVLVLPQKYLDEYDTCDDLGNTKSKGPGAARNFCWDHSISIGAKWHWVMDDNLRGFYRYHKNNRNIVTDGTILKCAEDFCLRYTNIAIAGLNYRFFITSMEEYPPFYLNTRIYSCLLIRNDIPYRWRGRYNEDTDISLRVLKDGWCTVLFNAFLCDKIVTQAIAGGNTEEFYAKEGTTAKSKMLRELHPDVTRLIIRFNRPHHYVDYTPFRFNLLQRKKDGIEYQGVNNYGMKLGPIPLNKKFK